MDLYSDINIPSDEITKLQEELDKTKSDNKLLQSQLDAAREQIKSLNHEKLCLEKNMNVIFNTAILEIERTKKQQIT